MTVRISPGFFSAQELELLPNIITALRLPLAVVFPLASKSPRAELAILALAGLSDILDGWVSRRRGEVTATGAVLDPIADKVFAVSVVATLVATGRIPGWGIPCLFAREIFEAPLLIWVLENHPPHSTREVLEARATPLGKAATVAEFAAILAAVAVPRARSLALVAAAVTGVAAGVSYWRRELRQWREAK